MVWLVACSTHGNLGCGWVKVYCRPVSREVESTGARVYDGSVVLVIVRALGLERGRATANIRRIIICFKMSYFICNILYVSCPSMSQAAFPIGRASACILGQFEAGVRLVKALFFTVRTGIGALLVWRISTCCAVGVLFQPSCEVCHLCHELGVGGNQGLIVDFHRRDCGRELRQNDLLLGRGCGKIV